jgi:hypothetical protein
VTDGFGLAFTERRLRLRELAPEIACDLVGLVGVVLVCRGVYVNWGPGWASIAVGFPVAALYVWRELATARGLDRSGRPLGE